METKEVVTATAIKIVEDNQPGDYWDNSAFIISQDVLLLISLTAGSIALISSIVRGCRNSLTLIIILLCGMILEIYCAIKTNNSRVIVSSTESEAALSESCEDFHSPSLLANGLILLTLTLTAVKLNMKDKRRKLSLRNFIFVFVILVCIALVMLYAESKHMYKQEVMFRSDTDQFYLSICEENLKGLWLLFILEMSLLYIPIFVVMVILVVQQTGQEKDDSAKRIKFIRPCYKNTSSVCRICSSLESTYMDILYFYGILFLVIRPAMFLYGYFTDGMIRDVVPAFSGVVQFLVISLKYCYTLFFATNTSTINTNDVKIVTSKQQTKQCQMCYLTM